MSTYPPLSSDDVKGITARQHDALVKILRCYRNDEAVWITTDRTDTFDGELFLNHRTAESLEKRGLVVIDMGNPAGDVWPNWASPANTETELLTVMLEGGPRHDTYVEISTMACREGKSVIVLPADPDVVMSQMSMSRAKVGVPWEFPIDVALYGPTGETFLEPGGASYPLYGYLGDGHAD